MEKVNKMLIIKKNKIYLLIYFLLLFVVLTPIWTVNLPPLFDYPNHLARMHILTDHGKNEYLSKYYEIRWSFLPNLAQDVFVFVFSKYLTVEFCSKLFISMIFFFMSSGICFLSYVQKRKFNYLSFLIFLLIYNRIFLWGFLNFLFSISLVFWAVSIWFLLDKKFYSKIIFGFFSGLIIYLSHIIGFGIFTIVLFSIEFNPTEIMYNRFSVKDFINKVFVLSSVLFFPIILYILNMHPSNNHLNYTSFFRKFDILFNVMDNYDRRFDVFCFLFTFLILVLFIFLKFINIKKSFYFIIFCISLTYFLIPSQMMSGSGADHRFPLVIFSLIFASLEFDVKTLFIRGFFYGSISIIFAIRMFFIEYVWLQAELDYKPYLVELMNLSEGAKILVAYPDDAVHMNETPYIHLPLMSVLSRNTFVSTIFAIDVQQPIAINQEIAEKIANLSPNNIWNLFIHSNDVNNIEREEMLKNINYFDYIIFIQPKKMQKISNDCIDLKYKSEKILFFKINQAKCN